MCKILRTITTKISPSQHNVLETSYWKYTGAVWKNPNRSSFYDLMQKEAAKCGIQLVYSQGNVVHDISNKNAEEIQQFAKTVGYRPGLIIETGAILGKMFQLKAIPLGVTRIDLQYIVSNTEDYIHLWPLWEQINYIANLLQKTPDSHLKLPSK